MTHGDKTASIVKFCKYWTYKLYRFFSNKLLDVQWRKQYEEKQPVNVYLICMVLAVDFMYFNSSNI